MTSSSHAGRLSSLIEADILSLKLKPGDKLDEAKLAERYGVSRTPVREALRQLSANGLIEIRPHKGAVVVKLGLRELVELLEVMAELEGACGRLAAKSCLHADVKDIFAALAICRDRVEANDPEGYKLANESFHDAIYRASHNSYLIQLTRSTRKRVASYRRLQLDQVNRLNTSIEEHDRIASAIRDGLPEETDRLLQLHILNIGGELRHLISLVSDSERGRSAAAEPVHLETAPALHGMPVE